MRYLLLLIFFLTNPLNAQTQEETYKVISELGSLGAWSHLCAEEQDNDDKWLFFKGKEIKMSNFIVLYANHFHPDDNAFVSNVPTYYLIVYEKAKRDESFNKSFKQNPEACSEKFILYVDNILNEYSAIIGLPKEDSLLSDEEWISKYGQ